MNIRSPSTPAALELDEHRTVIVYDGQCPFCSRFVRYQRLQLSIGPVELVDARQGGALVRRLRQLGYDLDEGMVLVWHGQIFHGDACINRLALLSSRSDLFNRVNAAVFRSPTVSRVLYPVLRAGRNGVLRMLGRRKIKDQ